MLEWLQKNLWKTGLLVWLGFNVVVNFLPYILVLPGSFLKGRGPSFFSYITGGELLIIAIAIAADSMGTILLEYRRTTDDKIKWLISAFIVLFFVILLASVSFIYIKNPEENYPPERILVWSFVFFLSSFATSLGIRSYMEDSIS